MNDFNTNLETFNSELEYYVVQPVGRCVGDDGKYFEGDPAGYGVVNKATGVVEHTSTILPGVLFQATHFDSTLKSLLAPKTVADPFDNMPTDDIVPN